MKYLVKYTLILLFLFTKVFAQINPKTVFVINNKPIQVVRFVEKNKFIVIEYIKDKKVNIPQMIVDSGTYTQTKWFIKFQSTKSNILNGNKLYLDKKLSANWWWSKKTYTRSDTNKYHYLGWIPPKQPYKKPNPSVPNPAIADYTKQFYIRHIHCYVPQYDSLMLTDFCGPGIYNTYVNNKYIEYRGDTSYNYLISDYETVVHESTHTFNGPFGYSNKRWRYKIMVDPGIIINYDNTETFQSCLFKPIVPPEAPKKIFRFNTYVAPGCTVSANLSGIYGLLDEFSAYRNGFHAALISHLKAKELKHDGLAAKFMTQANGTSFAYYEFRQFIAWYLAFAKSNYPKIYKSLMDNWNLRSAYTLIDQLYSEDLKLQSDIHSKSTSYEYTYYTSTYTDYLNSIYPKWSSYIEDFKIKDINSNNWKEKIQTLPPLDPSVRISRSK
jgi:hypothetical protein